MLLNGKHITHIFLFLCPHSNSDAQQVFGLMHSGGSLRFKQASSSLFCQYFQPLQRRVLDLLFTLEASFGISGITLICLLACREVDVKINTTLSVCLYQAAAGGSITRLSIKT